MSTLDYDAEEDMLVDIVRSDLDLSVRLGVSTDEVRRAALVRRANAVL